MRNLILKCVLFVLIAFVGYNYSTSDKQDRAMTAAEIKKFKEQSGFVSDTDLKVNSKNAETTAQANWSA